MKYFKVAAAIIKHNDEILCMQRPETECLDLSLKYEFPGGKNRSRRDRRRSP